MKNPIALKRESDGVLFSYNEVIAAKPGFVPVYSLDDKKQGNGAPPAPLSPAPPEPPAADIEEAEENVSPDLEAKKSAMKPAKAGLDWLAANKQMARAVRAVKPSEKVVSQ